ncbi:MAG: HEAT repeat domain-containing protein [Phycisphaerae bacterium]|jgi:hypothetical protein|nr:HEAT repeat domain-containing protein [Phycisphaerae bacterium]
MADPDGEGYRVLTVLHVEKTANDRAREAPLGRVGAAIGAAIACGAIVGGCAAGRSGLAPVGVIVGVVVGFTVGVVVAPGFLWAARGKNACGAGLAVFAPAMVAALPWSQFWQPMATLPATIAGALVGLAWVRWCLPSRDEASRSTPGTHPLRPLLTLLLVAVPIGSLVLFLAISRPPSSASTLTDLRGFLASRSMEVQQRGINELRRRDVATVAGFMSDSEEGVRLTALRSLAGRQDSPSVAGDSTINDLLVAALGDSSRYVRREAAFLLADRPPVPSNREALERALAQERQAMVREELARAIEALRPRP